MIFIILFFIVLLVLTVVNLIGLGLKIWRSRMPVSLKIFISTSLLILLIVALYKFETVDVAPVFITTAEIIELGASFVIALNWSLDISKKLLTYRAAIKPYISIPLLTIAFTFLIPFVFYCLGVFLDRLNLIG